MKLSVYTFVKDGMFLDLHVVQMLKHHLPFADEIVVNEGYSSDDTYEQIRDLDPKIRVVRNHWDRSDPQSWSRKFKDQTRKLCTGDWCILLDCDEFIPEWNFDTIRAKLEDTNDVILPMKYVHFYGNYQVYMSRPDRHGWPVLKHSIHRNRDDLIVWGDGSNVGFADKSKEQGIAEEALCEVHHFGYVRHPARLRQKWRAQNMRNQHGVEGARPRWDKTPGFVFDLMPHKWGDPDFLGDLAIYEGEPIQAVKEDPDEFVRDQFQLNKIMGQRSNG